MQHFNSVECSVWIGLFTVLALTLHFINSQMMNDFHITAPKLWKPKHNTLKSLLIKRFFERKYFHSSGFTPNCVLDHNPNQTDCFYSSGKPFTIFWSIPTDGMQANLQTLGKTSFITCMLFSYVKLPRNANDVFLKDNFATDPFLCSSTCEEPARLSLSSQTGSFKHFRKVVGNYFWQLQSPRLVQDLVKDELLQMNSAAPFFTTKPIICEQEKSGSNAFDVRKRELEVSNFLCAIF